MNQTIVENKQQQNCFDYSEILNRTAIANDITSILNSFENRRDDVQFKKGRIVLETKDKKSKQQVLEKWYLERAEKVFNERYKIMIKKFNYDFTPALSIRKMQKRWGSSLSKKKVLLNPELIKASKECIDYVITHELCHMKHQNHSKAYYKFLASKCHNWKEIKEQLELRFT